MNNMIPVSSSDEGTRRLDLAIVTLFLLTVASDFFLSYVRPIGPFPLRNYFASLIVCFVGYDVWKRQAWSELKNYSLALIYPSLVLINFIFDWYRGEIATMLFYVKYMVKFPPLLIASIFIFSRYRLKNILQVTVWFIAFNSLIAIFQGIGWEWAWQMRKAISPDEQSLFMNRPPGLAYFAITLSEQLLLGAIFASYLIQKYSDKRFYIPLAIICLSLSFNQSRSVILSLGLFLPFLFFKSWKRGLIIYFVLFVVGGMMIILLKQFPWKARAIFGKHVVRLVKFDVSLMSRFYAYVAGVEIIFDHFLLGLGSRYLKYLDIIPDYLPDVNSKGVNLASRIFPHNFFLNHMLRFGAIFGVSSLVVFYWDVIKKIRKRADRLDFKFGAILLGSISLNSIFHNGGVLNSSTYLLFLGLCFVREEKKEDPIPA